MTEEVKIFVRHPLAYKSIIELELPSFGVEVVKRTKDEEPHIEFHFATGDTECYYLDDYGKTWGFSKEDIKDDN